MKLVSTNVSITGKNDTGIAMIAVGDNKLLIPEAYLEELMELIRDLLNE